MEARYYKDIQSLDMQQYFEWVSASRGWGGGEINSVYPFPAENGKVNSADLRTNQRRVGGCQNENTRIFLRFPRCALRSREK